MRWTAGTKLAAAAAVLWACGGHPVTDADAGTQQARAFVPAGRHGGSCRQMHCAAHAGRQVAVPRIAGAGAGRSPPPKTPKTTWRLGAHAAPGELRVRVVSYNVEKGRKGSPEEIAAVFRRFKPDLIGFCEAPGGDWTMRVGRALDMPHAYLGTISSAHHKDKYKSMLSRTPFSNPQEFQLNAQRGWNPASAIRAETRIRGVPIAFYSLHIARSGRSDGHAWQLVNQVLSKDRAQRILIAGDFNNEVGQAAMDIFEEAGMRPVWRDLEIDLDKESSVVARSRYGIIDHVLYSERSGAKASLGGVLTLSKPLSDHKPVYAEVVFPVAGKAEARR